MHHIFSESDKKTFEAPKLMCWTFLPAKLPCLIYDLIERCDYLQAKKWKQRLMSVYLPVYKLDFKKS